MKKWFPSKTRRAFKLFQIEPSLLCSLSCVMCPWTGLRQTGGQMKWETFSRIQEVLPLTEAIDLTGGGEPLNHPRLLDMVRAGKESGCRTGFSTNGVGLTSELSQELLAAGLDWISFSVDAADAGTYERIRQGAKFDRVIENIARLSDYKARSGSRSPKIMMVIVLMTGDPGNVNQLPEYVRLAKSLGAGQVIAKNLDVILKDADDQRRVFEHAGTPDPVLTEAVEAAQKAAAEARVRLRLYALQPEERAICEHDPLRSVFFNWEGAVAPCITLAYAEERIFAGQAVHVPCQRFGDINRESFHSIWNRAEYREFRRSYEHRLRWEKQIMVQVLLGGTEGGAREFPLAPEGCRTCYYLYGI
jgi:MoaA/NifB/PqqE/SkfB family radical SAM enzyme